MTLFFVQVESFYVNCPCHTFAGSTARCTKSMQTNQPDPDTVRLRLKWWAREGLWIRVQCECISSLKPLFSFA